MSSLAYADRQEHLGRLIGAALEGADPESAVRRHLRAESGGVRIGRRLFKWTPGSMVFVIALGKAAPGMARAAAEILGDRIEAGIVTTLAPLVLTLPDCMQVVHAGHPLPDAGSLLAGQAALDLARRARAGDLVLALISGGGSAMAESLVPGLDLEDVRRLTGILLHAGVPITAINLVRSELSLLKAGGLAHAAAPAQVAGLLLSDVVGDDPRSIASGPTLPPASLPPAGERTLRRLGCWELAPPAVRAALTNYVARPPDMPRPHNVVIARNRDMLHAVAAEARSIGFRVRTLTTAMQGEAHTVGLRLGRRLVSAAPPACLLAGGETTVTIRRGGRGGRNQELALGAALALDGHARCALVALASDGTDGPTDAAGACVDGETAGRARGLGLDLRRAASEHDAYPLLDRLGALLRTGPTGTNLNDLVIGLSYA